MRKVIFFLLVLCSCVEQDEPTPMIGCLTAVSHATGERVFIRCQPRTQFDLNRGVLGVDDFYSYQWEPCAECK